MEWKIGTGDEENDVIENHEKLNIKWESGPGDDTSKAVPTLYNHWLDY